MKAHEFGQRRSHLLPGKIWVILDHLHQAVIGRPGLMRPIFMLKCSSAVVSLSRPIELWSFALANRPRPEMPAPKLATVGPANSWFDGPDRS